MRSIQLQSYHSTPMEEFLKRYDDGRALIFEQLPFNHPLYILYSSGTSGPPKCIVHSAGVSLVKEHILLLKL